MLAHGASDNYATAVLAAGDADYIPLVEEVQRRGKRVLGLFFESGLSLDLRLACDDFQEISSHFVESWRSYQRGVVNGRHVDSPEPPEPAPATTQASRSSDSADSAADEPGS